jgi:hypothetical protein
MVGLRPPGAGASERERAAVGRLHRSPRTQHPAAAAQAAAPRALHPMHVAPTSGPVNNSVSFEQSMIRIGAGRWVAAVPLRAAKKAAPPLHFPAPAP